MAAYPSTWRQARKQPVILTSYALLINLASTEPTPSTKNEASAAGATATWMKSEMPHSNTKHSTNRGATSTTHHTRHCARFTCPCPSARPRVSSRNCPDRGPRTDDGGQRTTNGSGGWPPTDRRTNVRSPKQFSSFVRSSFGFVRKLWHFTGVRLSTCY